MARGDLQHVILIEVDDNDLADADRAGSEFAHVDRTDTDRGDPRREANPPRTRLLRLSRTAGGRRRWRPLVAAVVVLLVLGSAISELRVRQRAARLADQPGVLAPLDASLHEQWRAPGHAWGELLGVGDRLLVFGRDRAGMVGVTALDAATGAQVWRTPFADVTARGTLMCVPPDTDEAHLVCLVQNGTLLDGDAGLATPTRLVVLAADTGRPVADRPLRSNNAAAVSIGPDVVVTEVLPDGRAAVTRLDPVTGGTTWEFRSEAALRTPSSGPAWLYPLVENDVIVANGPVTWAFSPEGALLGEWHLRGGDWAVRGGWGLGVSVLPNGWFAVGEAGGVGLSDEDYGTVSETDARDGFPIPGPVLDPVVDDGSAPNVLLTAPAGRGGIVAIGAKTGGRLWVAGAATWGNALVLDGRVIEFAGRELRAFDAQTGLPLWSLGVPMGNHAKQVLTDGRLVLIPRYDTALGAVLTAVDPADGRVRWTAPLPPRSGRLVVVDGRLLVTTERDLVAIG